MFKLALSLVSYSTNNQNFRIDGILFYPENTLIKTALWLFFFYSTIKIQCSRLYNRWYRRFSVQIVQKGNQQIPATESKSYNTSESKVAMNELTICL